MKMKNTISCRITNIERLAYPVSPCDLGGAASEKCGPWITTSKQEISLACAKFMLWFALNLRKSACWSSFLLHWA